MKKFIATAIATMMVATMVTGCGGLSTSTEENDTEEPVVEESVLEEDEEVIDEDTDEEAPEVDTHEDGHSDVIDDHHTEDHTDVVDDHTDVDYQPGQGDREFTVDEDTHTDELPTDDVIEDWEAEAEHYSVTEDTEDNNHRIYVNRKV